ncbi:MAG: PepSY domain-containing protein [Actinomycetota bacterium]|nr:PepSY domain-containing protein [Actinomycetota bacterium]
MVIGLLVLAFVVSKGCQQSQIKLTQDQAVATAKRQVDFRPQDTQVRLLRQGLGRQPYWIVSLLTLTPSGDKYLHLALVRIDAGTGEVVEVKQQGTAKSSQQGGKP